MGAGEAWDGEKMILCGMMTLNQSIRKALTLHFRMT